MKRSRMYGFKWTPLILFLCAFYHASNMCYAETLTFNGDVYSSNRSANSIQSQSKRYETFDNIFSDALDEVGILKTVKRRQISQDNVFVPPNERFTDYFSNVDLKMSSNETMTKNLSDINALNDSSLEDPYADCVGDLEYCNFTREQYIKMLNEYIFPSPFEGVLIFSHSLIFLIGLIGNALVCVAVYRNHTMRTVTNYFIVNLAVADFMVILICLPPTVLWDVTETWFFGNAMCRIILYFQSVSVTVSVLTLTFISVDRWYAICFPLKFKSTTGRAKMAIFVIWVLSLTFNLPEFVVLQTVKSNNVRFDLDYFTQCAPTWSKENDLTWHIIKVVFLYTLPLFLMTIAYCQIVRVLWKPDNIPGHCESHKYTSTGPPNYLKKFLGVNQNRRNNISPHANATTEGQLKSRRKAAKMLVAVVVMFAVCYFPVHLLSVLRFTSILEMNEAVTCLALLSHWLCYANSAVNPLIYNFMSGFPGPSGKFRREFRRSFFKCSCCGLCAGRGSGQTAQGNSNNRGTVSRAGTRRSESCVSYRLANISPSNYKRDKDRDCGRTHTSFIENNNSNRKNRSDSVSENPVTRLTLATELDSRQ